MLITYELSKNLELLQQYYRIREKCFRRDLGIPRYDGSAEQHDQEGDVLIARLGDRCIGGMRITGAVVGRGIPLEDHGLDIHRFFPQLEPAFRGGAYCQWERLALVPEYRCLEVVREAYQTLIDFCIELGYRVAFNVAAQGHARLYRRLHQSLGYAYKICNYEVMADKAFAGLEHLLSVACLDKGASPFEPINFFESQAESYNCGNLEKSVFPKVA